MCHDAFRNYRLQPGHISQLGINLGVLFIITRARTAIIGDALVARRKLLMFKLHEKTHLGDCQNDGPSWVPQIRPRIRPRYNRDPKRDHNFDNHPFAEKAWQGFKFLQEF